MPRPSKKLSATDLKEIEFMAGMGLTQQHIADIKGMSVDTLRKYALKAYQRGKSKGIGRVAQTAFEMAMSGKFPAMTIFWLKTQGGWRETATPWVEVPPLQADTLTVETMPLYLVETFNQLLQGRLPAQSVSAITTLATLLMKCLSEQQEAEKLKEIQDSPLERLFAKVLADSNEA